MHISEYEQLLQRPFCFNFEITLDLKTQHITITPMACSYKRHGFANFFCGSLFLDLLIPEH